VVGLTALYDDGVVRVRVRDFGAWQHTRQREDGGFGFALMRALMDSVEVLEGREGTTVVMTRRVRR
jgi:anti-sigma regulatory factor (Ser/Thr protein kinase)